MIQDLTTLSQEERIELALLESEAVLTAQQLSETLKHYPPRKIFKLTQQSDILKKYCEIEGVHTAEWSILIKEAGGVGRQIISVDKQETCSILQQYTSLFFFKRYRDISPLDSLQARTYLDQACNMGFLHALIERIRINQDKIKNNPYHLEKETMDQFYSDLYRLGNLYWTMGYIHSALVLLDIGNFFDNTKKFEFEKNAREFHEAALESFFSARLLDNPKIKSSTELFDIICRHQKLEIYGFATWDEAGKDLLDLVEKKTRDQIFDKVRNKMQAYYPKR